MFLTGNTSRSAPKHSVLDGRNGTVISGQNLSSDKEVPQARGRGESTDSLGIDLTFLMA